MSRSVRDEVAAAAIERLTRSEFRIWRASQVERLQNFLGVSKPTAEKYFRNAMAHIGVDFQRENAPKPSRASRNPKNKGLDKPLGIG